MATLRLCQCENARSCLHNVSAPTRDNRLSLLHCLNAHYKLKYAECSVYDAPDLYTTDLIPLDDPTVNSFTYHRIRRKLIITTRGPDYNTLIDLVEN